MGADSVSAGTVITPHGDFTLHANNTTRGPNNEIAIYVICACGRGYSWERSVPGNQLLAWLANHGPDVAAEEERRRVEEAPSIVATDAEIDTICEAGLQGWRDVNDAISELYELQADIREVMKTIRFRQGLRNREVAERERP